MIDAAGPWGTGPFTLTEGYSSILTRCAIMRSNPLACSWLIESEDRSDRLVLEANRAHWNIARVPWLERVVFRNNLTPSEALNLCVSTDGEVDIVTEVSPADAARVQSSEFARLVPCDANCVLVGILNRYPEAGPLQDKRVRKALNLAVDRQRIIAQGLGGFANPLRALTPSWCAGFPSGAEPPSHDPEQARALLTEVGWPAGRRAARCASPRRFRSRASRSSSRRTWSRR